MKSEGLTPFRWVRTVVPVTGTRGPVTFDPTLVLQWTRSVSRKECERRGTKRVRRRRRIDEPLGDPVSVPRPRPGVAGHRVRDVVPLTEQATLSVSCTSTRPPVTLPLRVDPPVTYLHTDRCT